MAGSRQFYQNSSDNESSTDSESYQDKCTLTFTPDANSTYLIIATANINDTDGSLLRLYDGSTVLFEHIYEESKDSDDYPATGGAVYVSFGDTPAEITYRLQYHALYNAYIKFARIIAIKLTENDQIASATSRTTTTSSSWQDKVTKTFTPGSAGDYLIIGSCTLDGSSNSYDVRAQIDVDGSAQYGLLNVEPGSYNETAQIPFLYFQKVTLTQAEHTIKLQYSAESQTTGCQYAYLTILRLDDFPAVYSAEQDTEQSATTRAHKLTLDTSAAEATDHLILASCRCTSKSTSNSVGVGLYEGTTNRGFQDEVEMHDTSNYRHYMCGFYTAAPEATYYIDLSGVGGTGYADDLRLYALQLTSSEVIVELVGSTIAESNSSGLVDRQQKLIGSTGASASSEGIVGIIFSLSGTSESSSNAPDALLSRDMALAGSCSATSSTPDTVLSVDYGFVGVTEAISESQAHCSVERIIQSLVGGTASMQGALSVDYALFGLTEAEAFSEGALEKIVGLVGSCSAESTSEGTLDRQQNFAGITESISSSEGILDRQQNFVGITESVSSSEGSLDTGIGLIGTCSAISSSEGSLEAGIGLIGTCNAEAYSEGVISLTGTIELSGLTEVESSSSGSLDRNQGLEGFCDPVSESTGFLSIDRGLSGTTAAELSSEGSLYVFNDALVSVTEAESTSSGTLVVEWGLAGITEAGPQFINPNDGTLTLNIGLKSTTETELATTGSLIVDWSLAGQADAIFESSGLFDKQPSLAGITEATSSSEGIIIVFIPFAGISAAISDSTAFLSRIIEISGIAAGECSSEGFLSLLNGLVGSTTAVSGESGFLTLDQALVGYTDAVSESDGAVVVIYSLAGKTDAVSSSEAFLIKIVEMIGAANAVSGSTGQFEILFLVASWGEPNEYIALLWSEG